MAVKEKLRKFKIICELSKMDEDTTEKASNSKFADFEDALQYFGAIDSDYDMFITRNTKGFKLSAIPVMSAEEYLKSVVQI